MTKANLHIGHVVVTILDWPEDWTDRDAVVEDVSACVFYIVSSDVVKLAIHDHLWRNGFRNCQVSIEDTVEVKTEYESDL